MCRKRLSSPRCRSELIDSARVVIVPGQKKCIKNTTKNPLNGHVPTDILFDFEQAAMNSARNVFVGVHETGCFFHLSQNIWKKNQQNGLAVLYETDDEFSISMRMIPALAFVPDADVPQADVPQADVPQADVPQADVPQADVPQADVPQADVPQADVPQADVPQADVPQADVPQADVPQADVPQADVPQADVPQADVPQADVPQADVPQADVPQADVPQADVPQADVPQADVPQADVPQADVPQADVPQADVPQADVPQADVPQADVPQADVPQADVPQADVPQADVPQADVPQADVPQADVPQADVPQADVPQADVPQADVPQADVPQADVPQADVPQADVPQAFYDVENEIRNNYYNNGIDVVMDYFEDTHIGRQRRGRSRGTPMFALNIWNMNVRTRNELRRTNNHIEGWHRRFSGNCDCLHPNIWKFIRSLQREESLVRAEVHQVLGGHPVVQKKVRTMCRKGKERRQHLRCKKSKCVGLPESHSVQLFFLSIFKYVSFFTY